VDKEKVTSQSLLANVSSYYTNLVASGDWKLEINKHKQIIALTTQISELKTAMSQVKTSTKPSGDTNKFLCNQNDAFQMWHLTKVENGNEFNMIEKDGTKYYWCDNHKHPDREQLGMYVFHKPTEHDAWKKKKDEFNAMKKGRGQEYFHNMYELPSILTDNQIPTCDGRISRGRDVAQSGLMGQLQLLAPDQCHKCFTLFP
jgi:hypothetical protein